MTRGLLHPVLVSVTRGHRHSVGHSEDASWGARLLSSMGVNSSCEEEERKGWGRSSGEERDIGQRSSWDGIHICAHTLNHTRSPPRALSFRHFCNAQAFPAVESCKGQEEARRDSVTAVWRVWITWSPFQMPLSQGIGDHSAWLHTHPLILNVTPNSGQQICYSAH